MNELYKMQLHEIIEFDTYEKIKDGACTHQRDIKCLRVSGGWIYNDKVFVPLDYEKQEKEQKEEVIPF
jgi:hypothetical protein